MAEIIGFLYALAHDAFVIALTLAALGLFFVAPSLLYARLWWRWRRRCWQAGRLW